MDLVSSFTNEVVRKALDGYSARHTAIASNLANVDTPGYRKKSVNFEGQLNKAIDKHYRNNPVQQADNDEALPLKVSRQVKHIAPNPVINTLDDVSPQMIESEGTLSKNDGNSVDVETEMVVLAENTQQYVALNNIQGRMLRSIKGVIQNSGG